MRTRLKLHQTLLNLCVNARDAMANAGVISIFMDKVPITLLREHSFDAMSPYYLRVRVSDTGSGMDEQTRRRIFEPFFTTKAHGKGTGLGLAVVYGIIKSHHGFIDLKSEVGKGTTFSLYFPVPTAQTEARPEMSAAHEDSITGGHETLLVVEDEDMLRELLFSMLKAKGYKVLVASDGEEAVGMYEQHWREIAGRGDRTRPSPHERG